jgi:hypothetical protein
VDDALGNALSIEVREFFENPPVIERQRAALAGANAALIVRHWRTVAAG